MIRQMGKPTVRLTLPASEIHCKDLLVHLQPLQLSPQQAEIMAKHLKAYTHVELVNNYPLMHAVYFEYMLRVIMNVLHNCSSVFATHIVKESQEDRINKCSRSAIVCVRSS